MNRRSFLATLLTAFPTPALLLYAWVNLRNAERDNAPQLRSAKEFVADLRAHRVVCPWYADDPPRRTFRYRLLEDNQFKPVMVTGINERLWKKLVEKCRATPHPAVYEGMD